jgi:poly(hydroxyalkanoate) depolymerase family esterase
MWVRLRTQEFGLVMKWSRELRTARRGLRTALKAASAITTANVRTAVSWPTAIPTPTDGLVQIPDFGSNPGKLAMFAYLPPSLASDAPLIVLLHGCGQTAATFAADTGWITLADRLGIPLLLPEQSGENNRGRCFNWFQPHHVRHGLGEGQSIREMVTTAIERFDCDPNRVFMAGLSAGGAMTAALMAAYPDVFAAGAVVAGLPVGAASSTTEALSRMAEAGPARSREDWAEQVRRAAPTGFAGPWPRVSIWQGSSDDVVDPGNARMLADQWSAIQGAGAGTTTVLAKGKTRTIWGPVERPAVELWMLPDLPHRWPDGAVDQVARFWGLEST